MITALIATAGVVTGWFAHKWLAFELAAHRAEAVAVRRALHDMYERRAWENTHQGVRRWG